MMVTDILRPEIEYTTEWVETQPDLEEALNKYNKDFRRFLFYPVGVFITAYNRQMLFEAIYELGPDYVYSDTDSVKYLHPERHEGFFRAVNEKITNRAKETCKYYGFDENLIHPKTIKGKEKIIGNWDYEGTYARFKTLGAKRYMVETEEGISITVSGVNKRTALPYICSGWRYEASGRTESNSPFNCFTDALVVPPEASGKLTHTYIDDEHSGTITDYLGNTCSYHELTAVHLEPAPYEMSLAAHYIDYLKGIRERTK